MPSPVIRALLASWRDAERTWEGMPPDSPGYREASVAVLRAWLAYQAATEAIESGTFALVADDDQTYVAVSDGVTPVLGYAPTELLGRRIEDIADPELAATTPEQWAAFLTAGRQDGEFRLVAKDGTIVALRFQARAHHPIPGFHVSRLTVDDDAGALSRLPSTEPGGDLILGERRHQQDLEDRLRRHVGSARDERRDAARIMLTAPQRRSVHPRPSRLSATIDRGHRLLPRLAVARARVFGDDHGVPSFRPLILTGARDGYNLGSTKFRQPWWRI